MSDKLKKTNQVIDDCNTTIAEAQEDVIISPDSSICSDTVNAITNIEDSCSGKVADIQEGVYSVGQLYKMNLNVSWIINDILPVGGLMILSGSHGIGKSFMSLDLAVKMTQKLSCLWLNKFKLQSGPVAYVDTENGLPLIKHRLELLGAKEDDCLKIVYRRSFDINNEIDFNRLSGDLKEINPVLIIIDSLRRCHIANENDAGNMSQVMNKIQNLHPAAKIVLHHTCKNGNGLRGSGDLSAVVDSHLQLKKAEDCRSIFTHAKSRWGKAVDDFAVDWIEGDDTLAFACSDIIESDEPCDKSEKIIQAIRDNNGTLSRTEIIKRTGIPEKTFERRLKTLVEREVLLSERKGKFMDYSLIDNQEKIEEYEHVRIIKPP